MSDTHFARNLNFSSVASALNLTETTLTDAGYRNEWTRPASELPEFILATAMTRKGYSVTQLRRCYRRAVNQLVEMGVDVSDLRYHVEHYAESYRTLGAYRCMRDFSDPVVKTAIVLAEIFQAKVKRGFKQTDETRNWGGWDGTFTYDYAAACHWLANTVHRMVGAYTV